MSTDEKVKFYKNPARSQTEVHTPYVPQYKLHGIVPAETTSTSAQIIAKPSQLSNDNQRAPRATVQQPYAEIVASPIGIGKGPVPNVGNNMEHTWSGVDGIIDDLPENLEININAQMIDNNDYVSDAALGISRDEKAVKAFQTKDDLQSVINKKDSLPYLNENEYLLLINGEAICSGELLDIENQVRDLVFGEHSSYKVQSIDDIVVLKRIKIKVGIFLE